MILFWVFCALFPRLVAPYDPIFDNHFPTSQPPTWGHPFGTDTNGRDVFSRVLAGSRDVLLIAPAATLLGTVLGTIARADHRATFAASSTTSPAGSSTPSCRCRSS